MTDAAAFRPALTLPEGKRLLELLAGRYRMVPVIIALVAIWLLFAWLSPVFLTPRNFTNLTLQIAMTTTISLGLVLVLLVGEIDLSVAFLSAVCAAIAAQLSVNLGWPFPLALLGGLLAGAAWGALQGSIVTAFKVPSFIVTLGGMLMLTGLLLQVLPSDTYEIGLARNPIAGIATTYLPGWLSYVLLAAALVLYGLLRWAIEGERRAAGLTGSLFRGVAVPVGIVAVIGLGAIVMFETYRGVPTVLTIILALVGLFAYLTTQTRFGRHIYAIGGNAEAARRAGIPITRVKIVVFALAGALAGAGGIIGASRVLNVSILSADPLILLEAIAAAVIGGASLFGGRGSVWAALVGALLMGSVTNGLFLLDVETPVRLAVQGALLILAVITDAVLSRSGSNAPTTGGGA